MLVTTEPGSEVDGRNGLKRIKGVEEPCATYGAYDVIAKVQAESLDKLKEVVTRRIGRLGRVRSTLPMTITEEAK